MNDQPASLAAATGLSARPRSGDATDARDLRRTFGRFPTGVTVVTCRDAMGRPVGMTANSFTSISLEPPLVGWSVANAARSAGTFTAAERFAFCILALDQVPVSNRFAQPGADKFAGVAVTEGIGGVPLIEGVAATVECERFATYPGGDHTIVLGRVVRHSRSAVPPLVFGDGRYGASVPHPGLSVEGDADEVARPDDGLLAPLLLRASTDFAQDLNDALAASGASHSELSILATLSFHGPLPRDALLQRAMVTTTRFTETVNALLAAGHLRQDGSALAATAAGNARLSVLVNTATEREAAAHQGLDATEMTVLRALLRKLIAGQSAP